jgi:Xaa-Pro aminopeptidase
MTARLPRLADIGLPDFGESAVRPEMPASRYPERIEQLRARMATRGDDRLVLWADREHSAGISFLTGFDPRFEEAILIVGPDGDPAILVGNESWGTAGAAPLPMRRIRFQDLSLPSQPRDRSQPLAEILGDEGVVAGARVGVVGWKTYADRALIEAPAFLVDELRRLTGPGGRVENAGDLLIDPSDGLRVINDVDQLAAFEWASTHTSGGLRRLLVGLRPGMTEREAVRLLDWNGAPLSCHLMLSSGPRATLGLLSPGDRVIEHGDRFTTAFGIWGALTCRAGFVVEEAAELPDGIGDYVERLVGPYFGAVAEWYETIRIGLPGGALQAIIDRHLGDPFFGIFLNPGHQIHLDEWVNSPISPGSTIPLRPGMAFQVDIIPATGGPYFTTNIEDGIALADEPLREAFAASYPEAWARIEARRAFMAEALGIRLHPEVLPFSNLPAYLPPFLLRPDRAMTMTAGGS